MNFVSRTISIGNHQKLLLILPLTQANFTSHSTTYIEKEKETENGNPHLPDEPNFELTCQLPSIHHPEYRLKDYEVHLFKEK